MAFRCARCGRLSHTKPLELLGRLFGALCYNTVLEDLTRESQWPAAHSRNCIVCGREFLGVQSTCSVCKHTFNHV